MRKIIAGMAFLAGAAVVTATPSAASVVNVSFSFVGDSTFNVVPGATVLTGPVTGLLTGLDDSNISGIQTPTHVYLESYPAGFSASALPGYGLPVDLLNNPDWSTLVQFVFTSATSGTLFLAADATASDAFLNYITGGIAELEAVDANAHFYVAGTLTAGSPSTVPEPWSVALLGAGLLGIVLVRRPAMRASARCAA